MRERRFYFLSLPREIESGGKLSIANLADEALLYDCDLLVEFSMFVQKARLTPIVDYLVLFVGPCSNTIEALSKPMLNELGIKTFAFYDLREVPFPMHYIPSSMKELSEKLPQIIVMFGPFGKQVSADNWHNAHFVDAVGKCIGNALAQVIADFGYSKIGCGFVHASPYFVRLVNHTRLPNIACQRIYKCSFVSHEKALFKAIMNECYSALERGVAN